MNGDAAPQRLATASMLERIVRWADARDDIRAAVVVGSQARTDRPADEWSDLDIALVCVAPERYLESDAWTHELGTVWLSFVEPAAVGGAKERRILFDGAVDVDVVPVAVTEIEAMVATTGVAATILRGSRVVLDKDGLLGSLVAGVPTEPRPSVPSSAEFDEAVSDFWYHAVWTAKKLRRGELWTAKTCCDGYLKSLLLRMIEWHTLAEHGGARDVWFGGRFLDAWADPWITTALRSAYAHYDLRDVSRALGATMALFRTLAVGTADRLGYAYPHDSDAKVTGWVASTLAPLLPAK